MALTVLSLQSGRENFKWLNEAVINYDSYYDSKCEGKFTLENRGNRKTSSYLGKFLSKPFDLTKLDLKNPYPPNFQSGAMLAVTYEIDKYFIG